MKKIVKYFIIILIFAFIIWYSTVLWYGLFSCYIPWEKSFCFNYRDYKKTLDNYNFFSCYYFPEDIPEETLSLKVFSQQDASYNRYTGYAIILDEILYYEMLNKRMDYYNGVQSVVPLTELLYKKRENEQMNILESVSSDVDIGFVSKIMQCPEQNQDYYFLVIIKNNISRGKCYTGIVANNTTHEMIEFSVEIPRED